IILIKNEKEEKKSSKPSTNPKPQSISTIKDLSRRSDSIKISTATHLCGHYPATPSPHSLIPQNSGSFGCED
ncbi:hypothetical protein AKJ16_DCAP18392, partial [Drosera capensis]